MILKEQRIEQMKNRIAKSKKACGISRQLGPLAVIFLGIVLVLAPYFYLVGYIYWGLFNYLSIYYNGQSRRT